VLGALPGVAQPTQKGFDTLVWDALRRVDASRPVFVESESKKVGNVSIPTALVERMRAAPCLNLVLPVEQRVALLLEDYAFFVQNPAYFCERLDALTEIRGKGVVADWKSKVMAGNLQPVVEELLTIHYDPVYVQSMQRNFVQFAAATDITPENHTVAAMQALAQTLV
jgi:tRNA 2-selenouridine synthase